MWGGRSNPAVDEQHSEAVVVPVAEAAGDTTARKALYEKAGSTVVELVKRYYDGDDASVLPCSIATAKAFDNAMALDIAMGGSTNTILHLLAAAQEAGEDYGLAEMDTKPRRVPCVAKVAPNVGKAKTYYMGDVHRAGGIPALLGELNRGGLLHQDVHSAPRPQAIRPTITSCVDTSRYGNGCKARSVTSIDMNCFDRA